MDQINRLIYIRKRKSRDIDWFTQIIMLHPHLHPHLLFRHLQFQYSMRALLFKKLPHQPHLVVLH